MTHPTVIEANPYSVVGSGYYAIEISKETGVRLDYGTWNSSLTFYPQTQEQYDTVVDLLDTFEIKHSERPKAS